LLTGAFWTTVTPILNALTGAELCLCEHFVTHSVCQINNAGACAPADRGQLDDHDAAAAALAWHAVRAVEAANDGRKLPVVISGLAAAELLV